MATMPRKFISVRSLGRKDMDFQEELQTNAVTFKVLVTTLIH